jgi:hypothetical protein
MMMLTDDDDDVDGWWYDQGWEPEWVWASQGIGFPASVTWSQCASYQRVQCLVMAAGIRLRQSEV